jgi:NADH:ubiquinone oxidoreductase subunit 5 (subunit L)/multisubunit Na+/H+ antiporter MnhA subunit
LVVVPLVAGALLALIGRRADRIAVGAGVVVALAVLGLAVSAAVARPVVDLPLLVGVRAGFGVDALSALMVVTVAAAVLAVLVFAAGESALRTARFTGLVLLFGGAMLVTVTATTLAPLLMAWEVMGATSWALIAYHWRDPASVGAAHTAFLTTRLADLGLYVAAGAALAGGVGSLALVELAGANDPWRHLLAAGVLVAALGKSAQLPFSFWLAGAMRGPSPVSALLHSATMVAAGAYLLLRLGPLLVASSWADEVAAWVGALTALLLGAVAVAQTDLKQLLAASTCAQIGYMVLAAGAGGTAAGALQLVAHAATKSLLFLAAGAWLVALGTRQLAGLRGAARRFPLVGVAFTIGAASLAGLPPLSLWVTKDAVLAAALEHQPALYVVGLAAAAVSAAYSAKAVWFVWQPAPAATVPVKEESTGRVSGPMQPPLVVLAVLAAALGSLPLLLTGALAVEPASAPWELAVSGALAVATVVLTWRLAARLGSPAALRSWLGLEAAAHALLVRPVLGLAAALARFDDRVVARGADRAARGVLAAARGLERRGERAVDGAVDRTAKGVAAAARVLAARGEPSVDGIVRGLAVAARVAGRWARWPQTGQLHQYYAQAAAAFAVLALFLIVVR